MFKKKGNLSFRVEICVESDDDRFHAYCPALKGVHVDGKTADEALENAREAIVLYIKSLIKHGDPIPLDVTEGESPKPSSNAPCPPQRRYTEYVSLGDVSVAL